MPRFAVALPFLLLAGCGLDPTVRGTGEPVTRKITVAMLNGITLQGSMDVIVTKGDTQRVEITAQPNLIDLVKTKVDNGMWDITTAPGYSTDRDFIVHLTVPMLNTVINEGSGGISCGQVFNTGKTHLAVNGSGSIAIDTLHEGLLEVLIHGSGSVRVDGTARELQVDGRGSGDLRAFGLAANEAEITLDGSGGVELTAISSLEARLSGSGSLRYKGKPEVDASVEGSGSVTAVR